MIYHNPDAVLGYDKTVNHINGPRSNGKTTGWLFRAVNRYRRLGKTTIYLRRYPKELIGDKRQKLLDTIQYEIDKDSEYSIDDWSMTVNGEKFADILYLTDADAYKSIPFPTCDQILFDEYVLRPGSFRRYLTDEPEVLLDLAKTVFRQRDGRITLLGNNASATNPHLHFWGLKMPAPGKVNVKGEALVMRCPKLSEVGYEMSRLDRAIQGTSYGDYALDGEAMTDYAELISKPEAMRTPLADIVANGDTYALYHQPKSRTYRVSCVSCGSPRVLSCDTPRPQRVKAFAGSPEESVIKRAYKDGLLLFDSQETAEVIISNL